MLGVFEGVIERASLVLDFIQDNKHIERLNNENISAQDQYYKVLLYIYVNWISLCISL